jgi:hypothetical protein
MASSTKMTQQMDDLPLLRQMAANYRMLATAMSNPVARAHNLALARHLDVEVARRITPPAPVDFA